MMAIPTPRERVAAVMQDAQFKQLADQLPAVDLTKALMRAFEVDPLTEYVKTHQGLVVTNGPRIEK